MPVEDTFKLRGLRERLAAQLQAKGISQPAVLAAFRTVPRHAFVESAFAEQAYQDNALPIQSGQTISQPYTVAYQTELLELSPGDRALEIGTGSGYQCAILCEIGGEVFTIERIPELQKRAKAMLTQLGYAPVYKTGDGTAGWPAMAPFDAIVVTAAAPAAPDRLREQLAVGGRLVVPVGTRASQQMLRIVRESETEFRTERYDNFKFVPLIGKDGWTE